MKKFNFWQKWLFVVSIYLVILGLFITFFNQSLIMNFISNNHVNPVFWKTNIPGESLQFQAWIYAVLGSTICGWGIIQAFIVHYPFKKKERWAWNAITIGIVTWYVLDTSLSAYYNVTYNVILNTILFLLISVPLLFTKKYFKINNSK